MKITNLTINYQIAYWQNHFDKSCIVNNCSGHKRLTPSSNNPLFCEIYNVRWMITFNYSSYLYMKRGKRRFCILVDIDILQDLYLGIWICFINSWKQFWGFDIKAQIKWVSNYCLKTIEKFVRLIMAGASSIMWDW